MAILNEIKNKLAPKIGFRIWPYLLTVGLIVLPWFLKSGYLFLTDNVWGPIINLDWRNNLFFINLLIKILSFVFSVPFIEKVFISSILLLILFSGASLVRSVLKLSERREEISAGLVFALSLFSLFNPFVYDRALYGQFGILAAYGLLVLSFSYLIRSWKYLNFRYLFWAAFCSGLAIMFSPHFVFLSVPFYLLFFVALFLKRKEIIERKLSRKFLLAILASFAIILFLNINFLIVIFSGSSTSINFVEQNIGSQDLLAFQTVGKTPVETLSNVVFMSGFWGKEQLRYFDLTSAPGWRNSFIFLLPLIVYGIFLNFYHRSRKDRMLNLCLISVFLLAVILAAGIKFSPTAGLSFFLYDHLPLYKGLREPQKWVAVIIPIYLFYLTFGVSQLREKKIFSYFGKSGLFILGAVIIMQAPSLLWGFNRQVVSTVYPSDWKETDNFLSDHSVSSYVCSEKVLFLPWHMYMHFSWAQKIIINPAPFFFSCPVISGTNMEFGGIYDNSSIGDGAIIEKWLWDKGKSGPPAVSGSKPRYIILAKEVDWLNYNWLNELSYLKPVKATPTLLIYEIQN